MIRTRPSTIAPFMDAVASSLGKELDASQRAAVMASSDQSLFLVAGPGSGKTTVLSLRVLKLVFADQIDPATILATTFTRRAASELRSRILGWGDALRRTLLKAADPEQAVWLRRLDLNRIAIGTLDSVTEAVLRDFRAAGAQPPVVLDEFVARTLLFRKRILSTRAWENTDLVDYLKELCGERRVGVRTIGGLVYEIRQRLIQDRVDRRAFLAAAPPAAEDLLAVIDAYDGELANQRVLDFGLLEQTLFQQLEDGELERFTAPLKAVLVDEYQDTNQLQELIYLSLARDAINNAGSIAVVGDDDQALYRFRGATVELFQRFERRLREATGRSLETIYLNTNYRSTASIVDFCRAYVEHDPAYRGARVAGKPALVAGRAAAPTYPILALLIRRVAGEGYLVPAPAGAITLRLAPTAGSLGDMALLCSTPREYSSGGNPRLPLLLRQALEPEFRVYNPRGQELRRTPSVACLCSLVLECIDPQGRIQEDLVDRRRLPDEVDDSLGAWRDEARRYIAGDPKAPGRNRHPLSAYVDAWRGRRPQQGGAWSESVELLKLVYDLVSWLPELQDDVEGLVYLEVITRAVTQSARLSAFDAAILNAPEWADRSVAAAIQDIFAPLATGEVDIDEDLLGTLPRDRLSVLSIHQAKGLEFPLTIVDVGSDFKTNHASQRFRRYPNEPGRSHRLEQALHPSSPLGAPTRDPLDRAFDDLIRQYFVAFSRPQDVLLLVGLRDPATGEPRLRIPNLAVSWVRDDSGGTGSRWPLTRDLILL